MGASILTGQWVLACRCSRGGFGAATLVVPSTSPAIIWQNKVTQRAQLEGCAAAHMYCSAHMKVGTYFTSVLILSDTHTRVSSTSSIPQIVSHIPSHHEPNLLQALRLGQEQSSKRVAPQILLDGQIWDAISHRSWPCGNT